MNTTVDVLQPGQTGPAGSASAKPLWAAVGLLGAAVLAMGGTMLYQQGSRSSAPLAPVAVVAPAAALPLAAASVASLGVADDLSEKPVAAPAKPAPAPAKKVVVKPVPRPAPAPSYAGTAPAPSAMPAPAPVAVQVCSTCGSVESVTAVQRTTKPDGPGVGMVAGGVAGAVLGNQVGRGNGRAAATVLGAIGGGWAGNAIERNVRKETVYQVGVRMDDGSRRVIEVAQPPSVGSKVTVDGSTLRGNSGGSEGAVYNAPAPVLQRTRLPQQPQQNQQPNY